MNATMQQLLDRDLVARPSQPESGRALPAVLTPTGSSTLGAAQILVDRVEQRMISGLTEQDRATLAIALSSCVNALEGSEVSA